MMEIPVGGQRVVYWQDSVQGTMVSSAVLSLYPSGTKSAFLKFMRSKCAFFFQQLSLWIFLMGHGLVGVAADSCRESLGSAIAEGGAAGTAYRFVSPHIYVSGEAKAATVLFLTGKEFQDALKNDSIPVNALLVLEELPLIEDLPLVSGIIVGKELSLEDTHSQRLAAKLGVVLTYLPNAYADRPLRVLSQIARSFSLSCKGGGCLFQGFEAAYRAEKKVSSVLPANFDRQEKAVYSIYTSVPPRELSGDKFFNLALFGQNFPNRIPDVRDLSSGYYEDFLDRYEARGRSLRALRYELNRHLEAADRIQDEEVVKLALAQFRQDVLSSRPIVSSQNIFAEISQTLRDHYESQSKNKKSLYAFRSNNDVEDLLAAGLYKSSVAQSLAPAEIERVCKNNWASLYDYRAYAIRRYWGQQEQNLSMPMMVHPYIDRVLSHGVGAFQIEANGELSLRVNMVLGDEAKATNPGAEDPSLQLIVRGSSQKKIHIEVLTSSNGAVLTAKMSEALRDFYFEVSRFVENEFRYRVISPSAIDIEFVLQKGSLFKPKPKLLVLQYKPAHNKEIMLSLLNGNLMREETDEKENSVNRLGETLTDKSGKRILRYGMAYRLDQLNTEQLNAVGLFLRLSSWQLRYALVTENEEPIILIWLDQYHSHMKKKIISPQVKWIKSGYVALKKTWFSEPSLYFTKTTYSAANGGPDPDYDFAKAKALFVRALQKSLTTNQEWRNLVLALNSDKIEIETFEDSASLELGPLLLP